MSTPDQSAERDRNLLFGVMAVQLKFITPANLAAAGGAWAGDPTKPLGELLVSLGFLEAAQKKVIDDLLELEVKKHKDEQAALKSFGGDRAVHESFAASLQVNQKGAVSSLASFGGEVHFPTGREGLSAGERLDDESAVTTEHPGRYTVKAEKGRGGIGRVLLAFDEHVGREVALKELLPETLGTTSLSGRQTPLGVTAAATARFLREARITGQLEHPGIVPVYEVGRRPDGSIYYTMKLVRGQTLSDRLAECKTLGERLRYLPHYLDLCQTMAYAHSKGVIHRDLKPQNVMVGEFGETVVLDWGLAKVKGIEDLRAEALEEGLKLIKEADSGKTVSGKPIGTPSYMPPEQAEGKIDEIDERSDVWSLGAVLYEMLTGHPPFLGDYAYEVLGKVLAEPVVPAIRLEPQAPPDLAAVCDKCLQKPRDLRYKNAGEIAADVAAFSSGGLVSAYDYSMAALAVRWVKKRWPVVLTAAIALVVLLLFGVWSFLQIREQRNQALEQKKIALEQKAVALKNLSEAYFHQGLRAERESRMGLARLYFIQSLVLSDREDARSALYREAARPLRPLFSRAFLGHSSAVTALAVSADGKQIVSAACAQLSGNTCQQAELKVWSADSGQATKTFTGHQWRVNSVAVSLDGMNFLTGSCAEFSEAGNCVRGELKYWSARDGELKSFSGHTGEVYAAALSPDGKVALSAGCGKAAGYGCFEGEMKLWSLETGEEVKSLGGSPGAIFSAAFSADGKSVLSGGEDKAVKLWNAETGEVLKTMTGHQGEVKAVALSKDRKLALSGSCNAMLGNRCVRGEVRRWDLESGREVRAWFGHEGEVISVALSPDAKLGASASCDEKNAGGICLKGEIKIWSLADGECLASFPGHQGGVSAIAFAPDGKYLISGGNDHALALWSLDNPEPVRVLSGHEKTVNSTAFSADGKFLATGASDKFVKIWNTRTGELVKTLTEPNGDFYSALFTADQKQIIAGDVTGNIYIWSLETGEIVKTIAAHQAAVRAVLLAPDGKQLVSASYDKTVKVWDLATGQLKKSIDAHNKMIFAAALSPDGKTVATGSMDQTVKTWDLATGKNLATLAGHGAMVMAVAFSPDGKTLASGAGDKTVKLWDLVTAKCKFTLANQEAVNAVAFSADGKYLLSGSGDGLIKLWQVDGQLALTLQGHKDAVTAVAFSPDGKTIASASMDLTARLFPLLWPLVQKPGPELLAPAEAETALKLKGFELAPWIPGKK